MLEFLYRRRAGVSLVAILLSLLALMSYQKKYPDRSTLLERVVYEGLSPFVVATSNAMDRVTELFERYGELRVAEARSRELEQEVASLTREMEHAREALRENEELRALLSFQEGGGESYVAARVLSSDPRSPWGAVWINRGRRDGIQKTSGVVSPDGVVGKVIEVAEPASKVQLLTDIESGVGGLVQRSRAVGVVAGRGDEALDLRYLSHLDDVRVGDVVVTSGLDGIFPRGLVIGAVTEVENLSDLRKRVVVQPSVRVKNLEHVLVTTEPTEAAPFVALLGDGSKDETAK